MIRADRRANGYRDFTDEALVVVRLIRQGQALGFSLREIAEVLHGLQGEMSAEAVTDLLVARIAEVDTRIASLQALRGLLDMRLQAVCPLGIGQVQNVQRSGKSLAKGGAEVTVRPASVREELSAKTATGRVA